MSKLVKHYDPNNFNCGRITKQTVEVILKNWEYKETFIVECIGNVRGKELVEQALSILGEKQTVLLKGKREEYLCCNFNDSDAYDESEWVGNMLVGFKILAVEVIEE